VDAACPAQRPLLIAGPDYALALCTQWSMCNAMDGDGLDRSKPIPTDREPNRWRFWRCRTSRS
jgi:hypothetical protein